MASTKALRWEQLGGFKDLQGGQSSWRPGARRESVGNELLEEAKAGSGRTLPVWVQICHLEFVRLDNLRF